MGGKVICKYYNPLALRDCVEGRTDRTAAAPTRREDISNILLLLSSYNRVLMLHVLCSVVWKVSQPRILVSKNTSNC